PNTPDGSTDGGNQNFDAHRQDAPNTYPDGAIADVSHPSGSWTVVPSGTTQDIHNVWGSGASDVYAVVSRSLLHYAGSAWLGTMSDYVLSSVAGSGPSDAWVLAITIPPNGSAEMGHLVFQHNTGSGFTDSMPTLPALLGSMHFAAADNGWAVGVQGAAAHWNGTAWTTTQTGLDNSTIYAVYTLGPTDAIAVGEKIWRWNGTTWTMQPTVTADPAHNFAGVWASGPNDIWTVAQFGFIQHWNGTTWEDSDPGNDASGNILSVDLFGVWGTGSNDVWAVGDFGTIIHFNGVAWTLVAGGGGGGPTQRALHGVWGSSAGDIWAVGDVGTILHYH
ncbi:MAG: hypothetical protein WCJ30_17770, partial [Deltaproteobacteria bacterium]